MRSSPGFKSPIHRGHPLSVDQFRQEEPRPSAPSAEAGQIVGKKSGNLGKLGKTWRKNLGSRKTSSKTQLGYTWINSKFGNLG